jgi:hypothetical protein
MVPVVKAHVERRSIFMVATVNVMEDPSTLRMRSDAPIREIAERAGVGTKRGLATDLQSGDLAFQTLHSSFDGRLAPALHGLLEAISTSRIF